MNPNRLIERLNSYLSHKHKVNSTDIFKYTQGLEAQIASILADNATLKAKIALLTPVTPPVIIPPSSGLTDAEKQFSNVWIIDGANGTMVSTIQDKIGTQHLIGTKALPILDGRLVFNNVPGLAYKSSPLQNPIQAPFTAVFVRMKLPGQDYEAFSIGGDAGSGSNGLYVGHAGGSIRFMSPSNILNVAVPDYYTPVIEQVVVNTNNTAEYWRNGQKLSTISVTPQNILKYFHSIGVDTNNMDIDFKAMYFKQGTLDMTNIYPVLAAKYLTGTPNQVLLSNIKWTNNNGTYTPSATVIKGTAAVAQSWNYRWYTCAPNNGGYDYGNQTLISTSFQVTNVDQTKALRLEISPVSSTGQSWRYLSGTFGLATNQSQQ